MAIELEDFGTVIAAIVVYVVGFAAIVVATVAAVVGFGLVLALLAHIPIEIGRHFQNDRQIERMERERHDEWATALIVGCIHRGGRAKFGNRDEYLGCEPLP